MCVEESLREWTWGAKFLFLKNLNELIKTRRTVRLQREVKKLTISKKSAWGKTKSCGQLCEQSKEQWQRSRQAMGTNTWNYGLQGQQGFWISELGSSSSSSYKQEIWTEALGCQQRNLLSLFFALMATEEVPRGPGSDPQLGLQHRAPPGAAHTAQGTLLSPLGPQLRAGLPPAPPSPGGQGSTSTELGREGLISLTAPAWPLQSLCGNANQINTWRLVMS